VLTALCLLLVSPFSAFATSIVTVIGGESITIAADGVLIGTSTETGEPVRDSTCKIRCIHICASPLLGDMATRQSATIYLS
jgi:hypothetical protein